MKQLCYDNPIGPVILLLGLENSSSEEMVRDHRVNRDGVQFLYLAFYGGFKVRRTMKNKGWIFEQITSPY